MKKRLLTFLISFLLVIASVPAFTFAQTAEGTVPFHYVALGDATAMGYGMAQGAAYGKVTAGSYAAKIRDTLKQRKFDVTVSQLGMKGMRTEELRFLLDDSYAGDAYLSENFPNLRTEQQTFLDAIKGADLITYGLGSVNVGNSLLYLAFDSAHCSDPEILELMNEDENVKSFRISLETALQEFKEKIKNLSSIASFAGYDINALIDQYSGDYIDAATYGYCSFCKSYGESIRLIQQINPKAKLVVLGVDNMLENLSLSIGGVTIEIGSLYEDLLITKVNAYMEEADGVSFIPTGDIERFFDEVASYSDVTETKETDTISKQISEQFKDYCDLYEDDLKLKTYLNDNLVITAKNKANARPRALSTAYVTAAASLRDVTAIKKVELTAKTLSYLSNLLEENGGSGMEGIAGLKDKGKELMTGLQNMCLKLAQKDADTYPYTHFYSGTLTSFIQAVCPDGSRLGLYGADSNEEARKINKIIMAIGIRSQMGEGFFQMYSAKGHAQLASAIIEACKDKAVFCPAKAVSCTTCGNKEFWQKVDGTCYTDEALTNQADRSSLVFKALGHQWGAWTVVRKAAFCKDGQEKRVCMRSGCTAFETRSIPGLGPAGTKITKLTAGKKSFTVNWKKPSKKNLKKTTGYQIRYSLKSSMKGAKTVTVKKNKTVSLTVKKLKAKKKYYVQIRTYKTSGGKNYYSAWSASKTVKTK